MNRATSLKISVSGVRGVVGESLTPQLVAKFAQAFGTYLGRGEVIVGQDSRQSGTMVKKAVLSGLLSVGCKPVEVGICPIPSIQVFTRQAKAMGAIVVTASHNPKEWNGLKFLNKDGLFLNYHQVDEFLDIYHQGEFSLVDVDKYRIPEYEENPTEPHAKKLLSYLNVDSIAKGRFKVAIDCCNGAGAVLAPWLLERLGCQPVLLNCMPDGRFAHHPEPLPENIAEICRVVVENKADVGFVQDADADRLAVVNEKGEPLGEEMTLVLAAKHVLSQKPGPVVINLSTSQAIDDIAADYGVSVIRTKIGEINVVEALLSLEEKPAIGGEGNGGVILPAIHPCRDSFTAMGLVLEYMAASGKTVSELQNELPRYFLIKDRIDKTREESYRLIKELRKKYTDKGEISLVDGMKIIFNDYWVHIRPSNTEPIVRLIVEAPSKAKAEEMVGLWRREIAEISKWK